MREAEESIVCLESFRVHNSNSLSGTSDSKGVEYPTSATSSDVDVLGEAYVAQPLFSVASSTLTSSSSSCAIHALLAFVCTVPTGTNETCFEPIVGIPNEYFSVAICKRLKDLEAKILRASWSFTSNGAVLPVSTREAGATVAEDPDFGPITLGCCLDNSFCGLL